MAQGASARRPRVQRRDQRFSDQLGKPARAALSAGESLCDHCTGKCCKYFTVPIARPSTWDDYDSIRWYLAHGQTLVYVEDGVWYLVVMSRCNYLDERDRCRIYWTRPKVCRDYTTDECEYDSEWTFEKVFETPEQIWEYAEAVLPPRPRSRSADGDGPRGAAPVVVTIAKPVK